MADDANALMPFQQSRLPSETEYKAMCVAFAETERGRWFLAEYAKRNRNADTTMVIEAIKRIEHAVARQVPSNPATLSAALAQSVSDLRARAGQIAAEGSATLETVRRNAQKMRDVAWTLREWGTDSDLCDELDALATGIVDGCETAATPQQRLLALLDEWDVNAPPRIAGTRAEPTAPAAVAEHAPVANAAAAKATAPPEAVAPVQALATEDLATEELATEALAAETSAADVPSREVSPVEARPVSEPAPAARPAPPEQTAPIRTTKPVVPSQSLGAALLAQGIIAQPRGGDALAPLRRMSQAEKVALFT
jgi:hypothetical protein